ncbi:MarR family winged helix-turn-helix transcriptional regulator [Actinocorallia sp. A-T 12471]|uniref:MarR family winged helix-turn-helix transcriptional regulator n=1 Tax=Actinocorallia sp. A-T 12471 TaxID=3089813 RepID=UPI0029D18A9E|nr:MarR family transcriptional regulator [Actinocorallia sp. A-T 12471]MDX6741301.1 MarR family transcriptional regulator [Actinocorallia sp. A-T 12471]
MTRWLSDQEQRAWRGLLELHAEVWTAVARDLQANAGLSLGDYAVLASLSEAPEHRQRVTELARAIQWERSRLSHQLSRMDKRGLVVRRECPEDARGAFAEITARGLEVIAAAAPEHVASVRRHMFDALTPEQVEALAGISASVVERLRQSSSEGMNGST